MADLFSSYGLRPTVAGQSVPIGGRTNWSKAIALPDGFLSCSIAEGTTFVVNNYPDLYAKLGTNVLPYYPATSTDIVILKAKEVSIGEVVNADTLGGKLADYYDRTAFKNKIINGNFDIWQRGTSQTTGEYGSDDRWVNSSTGTTKTHSRQSFTIGQTDVPGNPKYFSRTVVTSVAGAGNFCLKMQRIEDVAATAGKTVTLSFWAKADTNKNIAVTFLQYLGTGGSPSSYVYTTPPLIQLTTSWNKYVVTVTIPSIAGKILGTNGNDRLEVTFFFDAGSSLNSRTNNLGQQSGTFDIAQVQLEEGSIATPFEQRPLGIELTLCQRYYEKSYPVDVVPGTVGIIDPYSYGNLAGATYLTGDFKVDKRAIPAMRIWDRSGNVGNVSTFTAGGVVTNRVGQVNAPTASRYSISVATTDVAMACHFDADAEL